MTHQLLATVILASEKAEEGHGGGIPTTSWVIGGAAFVVFMVLLFAVTRLNLDR